jgi:hypothetical protein
VEDGLIDIEDCTSEAEKFKHQNSRKENEMKRQIDALDQLVAAGLLASYAIVNVSADNIENEVSPNRNSDQVLIDSSEETDKEPDLT